MAKVTMYYLKVVTQVAELYLMLEVDTGLLLPELHGAVALLLGVEVELQNPHRPVAATDRVVSGVPHHHLDRPVPEHVNLHEMVGQGFIEDCDGLILQQSSNR